MCWQVLIVRSADRKKRHILWGHWQPPNYTPPPLKNQCSVSLRGFKILKSCPHRCIRTLTFSKTGFKQNFLRGMGNLLRLNASMLAPAPMCNILKTFFEFHPPPLRRILFWPWFWLICESPPPSLYTPLSPEKIKMNSKQFKYLELKLVVLKCIYWIEYVCSSVYNNIRSNSKWVLLPILLFLCQML